jgi:hypothetical protein
MELEVVVVLVGWVFGVVLGAPTTAPLCNPRPTLLFTVGALDGRPLLLPPMGDIDPANGPEAAKEPPFLTCSLKAAAAVDFF